MTKREKADSLLSPFRVLDLTDEKGTIVRKGAVNNCKEAVASFLTQAQCNANSAAVLEASSQVMNSDFIIVSLVGPMLASFIEEARDRGYDGAIVGGFESFPGYVRWDAPAYINLIKEHALPYHKFGELKYAAMGKVYP